MMHTDAFAEPVRAARADTAPAPNARALSARELLSKLEGDERTELQRAMQARDLEAVRAMIARHATAARIERDAYAPSLEPPRPMMRRAGGVGSRRRALKPYSTDEK